MNYDNNIKNDIINTFNYIKDNKEFENNIKENIKYFDTNFTKKIKNNLSLSYDDSIKLNYATLFTFVVRSIYQ